MLGAKNTLQIWKLIKFLFKETEAVQNVITRFRILVSHLW